MTEFVQWPQSASPSGGAPPAGESLPLRRLILDNRFIAAVWIILQIFSLPKTVLKLEEKPKKKELRRVRTELLQLLIKRSRFSVSIEDIK